jgi:hypothetical protein
MCRLAVSAGVVAWVCTVHTAPGARNTECTHLLETPVRQTLHAMLP